VRPSGGRPGSCGEPRGGRGRVTEGREGSGRSLIIRLQAGLASAGLSERVRIGAITYDPQFDSPSRLKGYAVARSFRPGEGHRLLPAKRGMQARQDYFSLGVKYVHSVVNRHRVELYLLDTNARVAASFLRLEWGEKEALDEVRRLVGSPARDHTGVRKIVSMKAELS
jgi:protein SCO1